MPRLPRRELSSTTLSELTERIVRHAERGEFTDAWGVAAPMIEAAPHQRSAALALTRALEQCAFAREQGRAAAEMLFAAYGDDPEIAGEIGVALGAVHEINFLNAAPPDAAIFARVAERLREHAQLPLEPASEVTVQNGLATVARLLGRSWDATAEQAYRRLVALRPEIWQTQYGIGLFFKTRGRFAEGLAANQRAAELDGDENESVRWNLGICATGAGDALAALKVWKALGQQIEIGRFGLPDGGYPSVKVRLAERPLAERDLARMPDDPGLEETVWVERLSPCHGIVRSALYRELGVDYGDVVLFDGAPITHHKYGDQQVPVFPHLSTLVRSGYRLLAFAGTQSRKGEIAELSDALPDDAVVYVHSEQFTIMCSS